MAVIASMTEASQAATPSFSQRRLRVLLIDDDDLVRKAIATGLRSCNIQVDDVGSALEGLALLESNDYDVVISDLVMSGMDGAGLTRAVKQIRRTQPVLVLSGWGAADTFANIDPEEAPDAIMEKPPRIKKLCNELRRLAGTNT